MEDTQLMKGILEGVILSIIARGETYGYEILAALQQEGFDNLVEGTLYPVLTRLEKKKLISCRRQKSPMGPIRKYFSITEQGQQALHEFRENYRRVTDAADRILLRQGEKE